MSDEKVTVFDSEIIAVLADSLTPTTLAEVINDLTENDQPTDRGEVLAGLVTRY